MTSPSPRRVPALSRRHRASRVLGVLEAWALVGVVAHAMPIAQQDEMIADLRRGDWQRTSERLDRSDAVLAQILEEYDGRRDRVVVVGWNIDEEPAVLLSFEVLKRSVRYLWNHYPHGFLLSDQAVTSVLMVEADADEAAGIRVDRLTLNTRR